MKLRSSRGRGKSEKAIAPCPDVWYNASQWQTIQGLHYGVSDFRRSVFNGMEMEFGTLFAMCLLKGKSTR